MARKIVFVRRQLDYMRSEVVFLGMKSVYVGRASRSY